MPVIHRLKSHKQSILDEDPECNSQCIIFMMFDINSQFAKRNERSAKFNKTTITTKSS